MAYRSDIEALEARHAALQAEVADRVRARDEAAQMLAEARARERTPVPVRDAARMQRKRVVVMILGMAMTMATMAFVAAASTRMAEKRDAQLQGERTLAQFAAFTNQICACRDMTCVNTVSDEMARWAAALAEQPDSLRTRPSDVLTRRATELSTRMTACMTALAEASAP